MRNTLVTGGLLAATLVLAGCQSAKWNNTAALDCERLEVQMSRDGRMVEIEHHIDPAKVPPAVVSAMNALHPGGAFTDAEMETHKGVVYFELNREVDGFEVEAMFTKDGVLHSEEIQIPVNKVPDLVRAGAAAAVPDARPTAWEEIRDGQRNLVEYHVKMATGNRKWKVALMPTGKLLGVWREVPAEIEVRR